LPAEYGAQESAEGQQHSWSFEAEVHQVVGKDRDQPGHQRGLDAIPARFLPEPAPDENQEAEQDQGARDPRLDEDADRLVLHEFEPGRRAQGLIHGIDAAEGAKSNACRMRDHHGQGILSTRAFGQVVAHGAAKFGDDLVAAQADGGAHHDQQGKQNGRESAAVQRLALV
jgi:hypothetical protein